MANDTQVFYPVLRYRDARAAIDWLCEAFGFERVAVHEEPDGSIGHAELGLGNGRVIVGSARDPDNPFTRQPGQTIVYVVVDDPDAHHVHAKAAGATIVFELTDQDYGSRDYGAQDPEGNIWSFGTYVPER